MEAIRRTTSTIRKAQSWSRRYENLPWLPLKPGCHTDGANGARSEVFRFKRRWKHPKSTVETSISSFAPLSLFWDNLGALLADTVTNDENSNDDDVKSSTTRSTMWRYDPETYYRWKKRCSWPTLLGIVDGELYLRIYFHSWFKLHHNSSFRHMGWHLTAPTGRVSSLLSHLCITWWDDSGSV